MSRKFRRLWKTCIGEECSEGVIMASTVTSVSSSKKTLQSENERLKADLEKLKNEYREPRSSSGAPRTSSRTRSELAAVKEELEQIKLNGKLEQRKTAIKAREEEIGHLIETAQTLDLAFLFDATGSMQPRIEQVKDTITKIAAGIGRTYPGAKMRVGFAVYRDYNDKRGYGEKCDFTKSFKGCASEFVSALSCVRAKGGDDDAEDVFTGLQRVASLSWSATNRVVYHIADAPCHGSQFHDSSVEDNYLEGDLMGRSITDLLRTLRDKSQISSYYFCHLNKSTEKMLQEFRKAAPGKGDWIYEDNFQDVKTIPLSVVSVCTETISKSLSTVIRGNPTTKHVPCEVNPALPQWSSISLNTGYQHKHRQYGNLDDLLRRIRSGESLDFEATKTVQVQIAPHPFSNEGGSRWPYYARVSDEHGEELMVVKRYKTPWGKDTRQVHAAEKYMEQMEVQTVSAQLAEEFNKTTRRLKGPKQVMFSLVSTLTTGSKFYNMEKVLHGDWRKYSSNGGHVNTKDYAATLQAFSHWTHERSKGDLMVADLQGVQTQNAEGATEFVLSDPAIHSTNVLQFTSTNLGNRGFELFYKSHRCNHVCRKLRLTPMNG